MIWCCCLQSDQDFILIILSINIISIVWMVAFRYVADKLQERGRSKTSLWKLVSFTDSTVLLYVCYKWVFVSLSVSFNFPLLCVSFIFGG